MADLTTVDEPARPDPAAAVGGTRPFWSVWWPPEWRSVASVVIVLVAFVLPLRGLFRFQGPPMEEGFMLVFPELVLNGEIPNRDFLHLYGPGSLWALAGFFKVFGVSLASERAFGLLQLGGIVFGVMALARPWGRKAATASGLIGVLITTTAIGLTALAWNGAVALGVIGLWVGLRARRWLAATDSGLDVGELDKRVDRLLLLSGLIAGVGLLFRPDLIIGIALGYGAVLWGLERTRILRWGLGLAIGVAPYLIQLVTAGPGHSIQGMLLDPVFRLRPGRSMPVPPTWDDFAGALQKVAVLRVPGWSLPAFGAPQQVFLWFVMLPLLIALTIGTGVWRMRREPGAWRPRVLFAVGMFSLGIMPQALQRPDTTHLAWVSCVPLVFLPATIAELWRNLAPTGVRRHASAVAAAFGMVLLLVVIPYYTYRTYFDLTNQSLGRQVYGHGVHHAGRVFYLGSATAAPDAQELVDYLGERAGPGERLFVGTADLRKTPYSDAYLYFLLPHMTPSTYYIEMDPGMANREGSGLAGDVESSDWLVLSHVWDVWDEPNTSRELMSDEANEAVRKGFCKVRDFGTSFELYRRCAAPSATEGS